MLNAFESAPSPAAASAELLSLAVASAALPKLEAPNPSPALALAWLESVAVESAVLRKFVASGAYPGRPAVALDVLDESESEQAVLPNRSVLGATMHWLPVEVAAPAGAPATPIKPTVAITPPPTTYPARRARPVPGSTAAACAGRTPRRGGV